MGRRFKPALRSHIRFGGVPIRELLRKLAAWGHLFPFALLSWVACLRRCSGPLLPVANG